MEWIQQQNKNIQVNLGKWTILVYLKPTYKRTLHILSSQDDLVIHEREKEMNSHD